jgi:hypothetical protein
MLRSILAVLFLCAAALGQSMSGGWSMTGGMSMTASGPGNAFPGVPNNNGPGWYMLGVKDANGYSTSLAYTRLPSSAVTGTATAAGDSGSAVAYGICPKNSFGSSTYAFRTNCLGVIRSQSGGAYDTRRHLLHLFGGGHHDYSGNENYVLNLNVNPVTLLRESDPSTPNQFDDPNYASASSCYDGLPPVTSNTPWTVCAADVNGLGCYPSTKHTASGVIFFKHPTDQTKDQIIQIGGSIGCGPGGSSSDVWSANLDGGFTNTWRKMTAVTSSAQVPAFALTGAKVGTFEVYADQDPVSSDLVVVDDDHGSFTYDPRTNAWKKHTGGSQAALEGNQSNVAMYHNSDNSIIGMIAAGGCAGSPISTLNRAASVITVNTSASWMYIGDSPTVTSTKVWIEGVTDASFNSGSSAYTLKTLPSGTQLTLNTSDGSTASSSGGWVMACDYNASDIYKGFAYFSIGSTPFTPGTWASWNAKTFDSSNVDTGNSALGNTCAELARGGQSPFNGNSTNPQIGGKTPGLAFYPVNNTIMALPQSGTSLYELTPDTVNALMKCKRIDLNGNTTQTGTLADTIPKTNPNYKGATVIPSHWGYYRGHFDYDAAIDAFIVIPGPDQPALAVRVR